MSISRCISHTTTHVYHCTLFCMHCTHSHSHIQRHTRQCKIFCKSEFCGTAPKYQRSQKSKLNILANQKAHTMQQKKTCYCTERFETEYVSWISIKTKIGTHAAGWPMEQKIRIYAIWWLHWKKVQRQRSLVVGIKKMKSLRVGFPSFEDKNTETQHDRFANTFKANRISEKNAQMNVRAVATVAKQSHSDTHTIKTFAFIETLTSIKMAHNGKEQRKCTHRKRLCARILNGIDVGHREMRNACGNARSKPKSKKVKRIRNSLNLWKCSVGYAHAYTLHTQIFPNVLVVAATPQTPHKHNKC